MKIKRADFFTSAAGPADLPQTLPEIAVVGRSNVGKSSLLNFLLGRKNLVSFSRTPGKTRTINYFNVNDAFYFVDIPGFGYAKLGKAEIQAMEKRIEMFFTTSKKIAGILYLMDIRVTHSEVDENSLDWLLQFEIPLLVVATKGDKLKKQATARALSGLKSTYELPDPPILTSSQKKIGLKEVWEQIDTLLLESQGQ